MTRRCAYTAREQRRWTRTSVCTPPPCRRAPLLTPARRWDKSMGQMDLRVPRGAPPSTRRRSGGRCGRGFRSRRRARAWRRRASPRAKRPGRSGPCSTSSAPNRAHLPRRERTGTPRRLPTPRRRPRRLKWPGPRWRRRPCSPPRRSSRGGPPRPTPRPPPRLHSRPRHATRGQRRLRPAPRV